MQFRTTKKIVIDEQKLTVLIRLGCPDDRLLSVIKTGKFEKTGDKIIDEILECLVDRKEFKNWGGNHNPKGINSCKKRKKGGQVDKQVDCQDGGQVVDKDIDIDIDKDKNKQYIELVNILRTNLEQKKNGRKINIKGWYDHIRKMVEVDKIGVDEIKKALDWYFKHFGEMYIPVIESASSLREKFSKLENAIKRNGGSSNENDPILMGGFRKSQMSSDEYKKYLQRTNPNNEIIFWNNIWQVGGPLEGGTKC